MLLCLGSIFRSASFLIYCQTLPKLFASFGYFGEKQAELNDQYFVTFLLEQLLPTVAGLEKSRKILVVDPGVTKDSESHCRMEVSCGHLTFVTKKIVNVPSYRN